MGYLDDILSYATGRGDDPYSSQDNSGNPILSEEQRKRILLGIHAPDLYPNINDPNASSAPSQRADLYGSPYPNIEGGEGPTVGGAAGTFDPARSRAPSIYEPGPNEAAYGEALRKPRPEYHEPKTKWWQNLIEGGLSSVLGPRTAQSVYQTPRQRAQEGYERQLGNYEGDIAQKRGAASLEIGERDRQRRGILDEMKAERDANLYGRQMETQQKQGAYYERKMNEPAKPDALDYLSSDDPKKVAAAREMLGAQHPVRGKGVKTVNVGGRIKVIDADTGEELNDLGEAPGRAGGAGGVADAAKLRALKVSATKDKDNAIIKVNERAKTEFMSPEEVQQAKQAVQDAFENRLEAGGHTVEHYEWPIEKEPEKPKPAEQPGMLSRAVSSVGSMFGGGAASAGIQERMSKSGRPIISKDGGKTWEYK